MRAIVGDETGLLKVVDVANGRQATSYGDQNRSNGIVGLNRVRTGDDDVDAVSRKMSVLRCDGQLELWELLDDEETLAVKSFLSTSISDSVNSVTFRSGADSCVVTYGASGDVAVAKLDEEQSAWIQNEDGSIDESCKFNVKGPLSAAATCSDGIAFGGDENDLKIYDLETMQQTWAAANVPFDKLRLRVPIWVTALSFMHPSEDSCAKANIVTGTGHKHIRFYDTAAGQRPVTSLDCGEFRVSSLCVGLQPHQVYVGDVSGALNWWDLRVNRKVGTLKGSVGSIRDIQLDSSGSHLASVGLDRILHVYNTATNKVTSSVYLKNRLNRCILFGGDDDGEYGSNDDDEDYDDDNEDNDNDEDVLQEYVDSDDERARKKDKKRNLPKPTSKPVVSSKVHHEDAANEEDDSDGMGDIDMEGSDDEGVDLDSDEEIDAFGADGSSDEEDEDVSDRKRKKGGNGKAAGVGKKQKSNSSKKGSQGGAGGKGNGGRFKKTR
jgi:hypothetical protein